ncbi:AI-2E family transporter [Microbacterium hydrocarbonoxydans]|uniref:Predicted PurR-regulated permease PerM n=1 Tax=Microbacterium hydrocarbonoxydans TaxID=273678 RepID=A0A1H4P7P0_9MICO|nr:AI-2E family transporter [Microbacterium hydrocarbonoxydans]SEC03355.1 Predicted PurR-regulated permease PerM [Microbacterium hydrocarbonoxydans]
MSDTGLPEESSPPPQRRRTSGAQRARSIRITVTRPLLFGFALVLGGLGAFVLGAAVSSVATILVYIAIAIFVALGLDPVIRRMEARGVSRTRGLLIVSGGFLVFLAVVIGFIIPPALVQLGEFTRSVPATIADFRASEEYAAFESQVGDVLGTALSDLAAFLGDPGNLLALGGGVLAVGLGVGNAISGMLIVVVLTLYFLASLSAIKSAFYSLAPARDRPRLRTLTEQITDSVGSYLIGMVILAACNAVFATLLHLVLGLPAPAFMGLAAFLITLIPLIGPVTYWIFATVVALFVDPLLALIFAVVYLIYMQFEAYLLTPRIMNRAIAVPGSLVIIGALIGGALLGLLGALVAIPVTAAILLVITQVHIPRQNAKL